ARPRVLFRRSNAMPTLREVWPDPAEDMLRVVRRHVHAAVTALATESRMPERAVERVTAFEVHDPRHVLDRVRAVAGSVVLHRGRDVLLANREFTLDGAVILRLVLVVVAARRDDRRIHRLVALERDKRLGREVDVDPLLARGDVLRRRARACDRSVD